MNAPDRNLLSPMYDGMTVGELDRHFQVDSSATVENVIKVSIIFIYFVI